jgi:hypothetical protein
MRLRQMNARNRRPALLNSGFDEGEMVSAESKSWGSGDYRNDRPFPTSEKSQDRLLAALRTARVQKSMEVINYKQLTDRAQAI